MSDPQARRQPARARHAGVHASASTPGACSARSAPTSRTHLGLSDFQTSAMVAVPVLLGSLMRIPLGWLTDRYGGRRVFTALMAFTPLPLVALALWHDSLAPILVLRLPARLRRRLVRGRRAVRQRLVPARAPGLRARHLRHGHGRHRARRADRAADRRPRGAWRRRSGSPPALVAVMAVVFCAARARRAARGADRAGAEHVRARWRSSARSGRAWALTLFYFLAFGGFVAMFLYLPKLLTGVHDLTKADAGARAAGLRAARRHRRGRPAAGCPTASAPRACCVVSFIAVGRARARARRRLHARWCR